MSSEDFKIEFLRSFFRLAVLILLTVSIIRDESTMWIWLGIRAAVLIEYISFSIKDEPLAIFRNFMAHCITGAVLAFAWYGAYVLFELKKKFFRENGTVLHVTVPTCIKWCVLLSLIGMTVSAAMYIIRQKRGGFR